VLAIASHAIPGVCEALFMNQARNRGSELAYAERFRILGIHFRSAPR